MDARKTSIIPLFPLLASHDVPTRLDASLSLLTALPSISLNKEISEGTSADDADTPYAIKRLVKGLASSNEASRQGFAVALTELLARLPTDQSATVLPLIISLSTPTAATDSREERELCFSRLLGLHACIRSGVLYRPATTNGETFKEVILALLALAGRKSWMMEPAYWVLIEGVRTLLELEGKAVPQWREEMTAWCIQRLLNDSREKARGFGPEKVALVLLLQSYGVEADYVTVLSPTFSTGNPLARASLVSLSQALKGAIEVESAATPAAKAPKMGSNAVKTAKGSAATPGSAPHFVWSEIFEIYFPESGTVARKGLAGSKEGRAKWTEVWRVLVDQSLFGPTSLSLKATGFGLLSLAIQRLPAFEIPALFGEGVMRTLGNHLRKSGEVEKTLARVAEKVVASLPPFLATNPSVSLPLLKTLVAPPHGSHSFDARTIEKVVAKLDLKGVRGWVKYLKEFVIGEEAKLLGDGETENVIEAEDEKAVSNRRIWAFDQLLHVAKSGALPKDDETLAGLLEFFAVLGWFEVRKSGKGARSYVPNPAFTTALQSAARSRFFSVLTSLPTTPSTSGQSWLSRALALLENLSADSKHFNFTVEVDEDVVQAQKEVKEMYTKLSGDDERRKTMCSLIEGVLLLSYDEGEDSLEAIEQLKDCVSNLFPEVVDAAAKAAAEDAMDEEDGEIPEPTTVLIDVLLELLHRPSAFIKSVAQTVFTGFSAELGEQAMDLLLDQIRPEEADTPEEDDEDEVEEDVDMTNGDAPEASTSKAKVNGKKAAVESDSDDSIDDDSDDDEAEVDEDFRNELLAALEAGGVSEALDAALDVEEDPDAEEELLNDDQMMAMDEKLAEIFRLQGGGKKGKKAQRTDDLHYRLRILDLLESLVKQRATNPLLVFVILPLFHIAQRAVAVEAELQTKAIKLLRLIVGTRKDAPTPEDPQFALDALTELHTISQSIDIVELAGLCSQACIFLVKAALASPNADAETSASISTLYTSSFDAYLSKKNSKTRAQPALTIEFGRRSPACAWAMFSQIVALAGGESATVNAYRRMQAFEVAQALLTSYASLKTDQSKSNILALLPSYRSAVHAVLSSPLTDATSTFDAARIKELIKLSLAAVRITTAVSSPSTTMSLWKADEFSALAEQYKSSDRFKGAVAIQNLFKQLVTLIGGPVAKSSTKRKNGDEPEKVEKKKSKKDKKVAVEVEEEVTEAAAAPAIKEKKGKKGKREKKP